MQSLHLTTSATSAVGAYLIDLSTHSIVVSPSKWGVFCFTNSINDYRYEEYLEAWVD